MVGAMRIQIVQVEISTIMLRTLSKNHPTKDCQKFTNNYI